MSTPPPAQPTYNWLHLAHHLQAAEQNLPLHTGDWNFCRVMVEVCRERAGLEPSVRSLYLHHKDSRRGSRHRERGTHDTTHKG